MKEGANIIEMKPSDRAGRGSSCAPNGGGSIFKESSVMENLRIGGYLASAARARKTLSYVFEIFPKLKDRHRNSGFLSGGEQQMLAIGRALSLAQPKVLLLDEPLLGLSPARQRLSQAVKSINQETGITVVISEQYARPVFPIIDYGYIIENGAAVLEIFLEELMNNPDVKEAYFGI